MIWAKDFKKLFVVFLCIAVVDSHTELCVHNVYTSTAADSVKKRNVSRATVIKRDI